MLPLFTDNAEVGDDNKVKNNSYGQVVAKTAGRHSENPDGKRVVKGGGIPLCSYTTELL